MLNSIALTVSLIAGTSFYIVQKLVMSRNTFENDIRKRFLKTIEAMNNKPINDNDITFGLENIESNPYGFSAKVIIPIGLSEKEFVNTIPYLENAFFSNIEYKDYVIKVIKKGVK